MTINMAPCWWSSTAHGMKWYSFQECSKPVVLRLARKMKELTAWWYSQSRGSSRSVTWRITVPSMLEHIYAGITDQSMAAFPGSFCLPPPTQELTTTLHLSNSQVFCNMEMKPGVPRSTKNNLRKHKIQDFMEGILPDLYSSHTKYTSTAPTLFKLSPPKIASHGHVVWVLHMFVKLASSVSKLQPCSCYNCKYLRYFSTGSRPIQFQEHGISPLHSLKSSHHRFPVMYWLHSCS